MPDKTNYVSIVEQKNTKPNIEDVIGGFLEGEALENAMNFVAFLRENGMNPRWSSANAWRVTGKKSKTICAINLGGAKGAHLRFLEVGDWRVCGFEGLDTKYLDEFISCEEMKGFVWANVKPCDRCCSCGPRRRTYIGKQFDECCMLSIKNPDARGLTLTKKIVEANQCYIYADA